VTGASIVRASWASTAAFVVVSAVAVLVEGPVRTAAAVFDGVLFVIGVGVFAWAYAIAVNRSRTDEMGIGGLFFLAGDVAEPAPRRHLRWSLGIQVVVAIVAASLRLYTALAFGVLVPILGLALMGLWGAKHGRFGRRVRQGR
jgi:hypothetical protein